MDAGVPTKAPVAGVAMGLIREGDEVRVLSDILGDEDHLGDMDFKVAGTRTGVTALQMDIKIGGVTREVMSQALEQAREARLHILGVMGQALEQPRADLSMHAPRIVTIKINPDRIRDLIGPGGKTIRGIVDETGVVPAVNQVEVHPYFTNEAVRAAGAELGVVTEAWSPIAQGDVLDDPVLEEIAAAKGRSTAQVALRWHVERGDVVFPKSVTPARIRENFEIFDFSLSAEEVERISGLDRGEDGRRGPNPDDFDYVPS